MRRAIYRLTVCGCMLLPALAEAQPQYAYPAKGQSAATQSKDEAACSKWATGETGFDPAKPPPAAKPAPVTGSGARVRGAAAGGVIGGVSGGDVGEAALAGAVVGGVARRSANRRAAAKADQTGEAAYRQARGACLKGRGYTLN